MEKLKYVEPSFGKVVLTSNERIAGECADRWKADGNVSWPPDGSLPHEFWPLDS